jgi:hypothetical protein
MTRKSVAAADDAGRRGSSNGCLVIPGTQNTLRRTSERVAISR